MGARERISTVWDAEVEAFLGGKREVASELKPWFNSYRGVGEGIVDVEAFPEPFLGPLFGRPKAAFLALNPGPVYGEFQYSDGIFVKELQHTTYTEWAARWRYLDEQHPRVEGGLRFHRKRLRFLRWWLDDPALDRSDMLAFELYPWHSQKVTAVMRPDPRMIKDFILDPIAESGAEYIFGFGSPWFDVLDGLGLEQIARLGAGGDSYPTEVTSRTVAAYRAPAGNQIVIEKHSGGAGPPSEKESMILREAFIERGLL